MCIRESISSIYFKSIYFKICHCRFWDRFTWFLRAAICSGVCPFCDAKCGDAPFSIKRVATFGWS